MKIRFKLIAIIALLSSPALAQMEEANPVARDILILTDWFEGEFDNEEQLWFENDPRSATPKELVHSRVHVVNKRIHMPEFGEHVFYVEEYKDNNPEDIIRQRFVIFSSDPEKKAVRMQQGFFKNANAVLGAQYDTRKLDDLTSDDLFFMNECDVYWARKADQFEGSMGPKACVFGEGKDKRYSIHNLTLSHSKYWRYDATYRGSDDSFHTGAAGERTTEMRRSKIFLCSAIFRNPDFSQIETEPQILHSQGGMIHVTRPSDSKEFSIRMRDKEYPYYDTRPDFLFLSIMVKGERFSLAYSVSDPRSRRVALFLTGEVAVNCNLEGYVFRETIEELN